jgi:hypothetical protein
MARRHRGILGKGTDAKNGTAKGGGDKRELPRRGREHRSLDELTSVELDTVSGAVAILLEVRFTSVMDDPGLSKLLCEFDGDLSTQKTEREELKASVS